MPDWSAEHDYTNEPFEKIMFTELGDTKRMVKLLAYHSIVLARTGDWNGAKEDLRTAGFLASRAGDEPILIGFFVQIACRSIIKGQIEWLVTMADLSPKQLSELG